MLNVKNTKTLNCTCISFFNNYIIQKHTQSSSFRGVYVFASLTVTVIYYLVSVKSPVDHCCTVRYDVQYMTVVYISVLSSL